jgi:hypothetical protein
MQMGGGLTAIFNTSEKSLMRLIKEVAAARFEAAKATSNYDPA